MDAFDKRPSSREVASLAWQSFAEVLGRRTFFLLAGFLIYSGLVTAIFYVVQSLPQALLQVSSRPASKVIFLLVDLLSIPAGTIITAPLAVAIHRFILLDEITPVTVLLKSRFTWLFFVWLSLFQLIRVVAREFGDGLILLIPSIKIFVWVAILSLNVVWLYSVLILPAIAVGKSGSDWRQQLDKSWGQVDGNFWLFFWGAFFTALPIVALTVLISFVPLAFGFSVRNSERPEAVQLVMAGIGGILDIAVMMLGVAVMSWIYAGQSKILPNQRLNLVLKSGRE